jgi:hypothetical protein
MSRGQRVLIYILLTALVEGSLIYSIFTLSSGLDLNDPTNPRYVARQYCYYMAYNIGYLVVFSYGMGYGSILSGFAAMVIGCIGMFVGIFLVGEIATFFKRKGREPPAEKKKGIDTNASTTTTEVCFGSAITFPQEQRLTLGAHVLTKLENKVHVHVRLLR